LSGDIMGKCILSAGKRKEKKGGGWRWVGLGFDVVLTSDGRFDSLCDREVVCVFCTINQRR